jgi:diguanylate cyclase (GGDEF)-like protein
MADERSPARGDSEDTAVSRPLLEAVLSALAWLQGDRDLGEMLRFLLEAFPEDLGVVATELQLLDVDDDIARHVPESLRQHRGLSLGKDSLALQSLYGTSPQVERISFADERMFRVLTWNSSAAGALLIPLVDGERLLGSYHLGLSQEAPAGGRAELELLRGVMHGLSLALVRTLRRAESESLMLLDRHTGVSNARALQQQLAAEISRASRTRSPLSILRLRVDQMESLCADYGRKACHSLLRRVALRIASRLRDTDHLARVDEDGFAVLLPDCSEPNAHDIGERLCSDIRDCAFDDGRGGVLSTTLSVGVLSWDPGKLPTDSRERLLALLETESAAALRKSVVRGGNAVSISRLGALMI